MNNTLIALDSGSQPPQSIEVKSPCTCQMADWGPNSPGSPLGRSKSISFSAMPVRPSTCASIIRRMPIMIVSLTCN